MSGKAVALILLVVVALVGIPATLYLVKTEQDNRSRASQEDEFAIEDETPLEDEFSTDDGSIAQQQTGTLPQVTGVSIEFPAMNNDIADFTQAKCSWTAVSGAANYRVTITEVETNTVGQPQTLPSSQTNVVFPVGQNKTYKCDVAAVNASGEAGPVGTFSLFCPANGLVSPTTAPTAPPAAPTVPPTLPPVVTQPPVQPTLPPTGMINPAIAVGVGSAVLFIIGGALLLF